MRRVFLAFGLSCAVLAVALYVVAFDTAAGRRLDARVLAQATADSDLPRIRAASTTLIETIDIGSIVLLGGGMIAAAVLLRRPRAALAAALLLLGANVTTQALKRILGAADPFGDRADLPNSWPSGHATVAITIALAAVFVAPTSWKLVVGVLGALYAAALGISLPIQGYHYPSDVAGAYLVAGAWAGAVAALVRPRAREARPESVRGGVIAAAIAVAGFLVAVGVAVATRPGLVVKIDLQTKLVVAAGALTLLAVAVAAGTAWLLVVQASALRSASTTRS